MESGKTFVNKSFPKPFQKTLTQPQLVLEPCNSDDVVYTAKLRSSSLFADSVNPALRASSITFRSVRVKSEMCTRNVS